MPCTVDPPSAWEKDNQTCARFLRALMVSTGEPVPDFVKDSADHAEFSESRCQEMACERLRAMTEKQREAWVYDAHSPLSRKLADWWERHQDADKKREPPGVENARIAEERDRLFMSDAPPPPEEPSVTLAVWTRS